MSNNGIAAIFYGVLTRIQKRDGVAIINSYNKVWDTILQYDESLLAEAQRKQAEVVLKAIENMDEGDREAIKKIIEEAMGEYDDILLSATGEPVRIEGEHVFLS